MSMRKLLKRLISLRRKIGSNVAHFPDFLQLRVTIHLSYKYKQIKVPNLVHFGSPSIALYNDNLSISIYSHLVNILLFGGDPYFCLKKVGFLVIKANSELLYVWNHCALIEAWCL